MDIALFLPNWLGDLVMATPVLRALRQRYAPPARIVGILRPHLADILGGTGWLDELWYFDPRASRPELQGRALVRRMRARRFDMAILLPNSLRSAYLAWRGRAVERIGFVRDLRGPFLTGKIYPRQQAGRPAPVPMVDYYLRVAEAAGCESSSRQLQLATLPGDERSADGVWQRLGLRSGDRVIALNASGAFGGSKLWPVEHFAALARRIAAELRHDVLVFCGPGEVETARAITRRAAHPRVFSMADQPLDLGTAKACVRRCRLMVSTDSGPRHVAAAFGLPVITLYGPILPIWSENPTHRAVHLILPLDCVGCGRPVCPRKHHRCMRELAPDRVFTEVVRLVEGGDSARAA